MTQQTNTTNWVIQGSNGQPQMIKLVQPSGKPVMTSTLTGQPVKIYKSPPAESSQVFTTAAATTPVLRAIRGSIGPHKILTQTVPIHVGSIPKGTRTIRLTQTQMQNIKIVTPPSTQKVQMQTSYAPTSTTTTPIPIISQSPTGLKSVSPPILSRKRHDTYETDYTPESKRGRKSEKVGKGLRHFSMKVCEKVRQKGMTTYNEVADELVGEFTNAASVNSLVDHYDQKNIRRRVYDALNVLMAMNIISKEKKDIRWIGLPTNSQQECHQLQKEVAKKITVIREKEKQLNDLIMNQIAFKNLAQRNIEAEKVYGVPPDNFCIQLPFIVVNTNKKTVINCSISNDRMEYLFQFSDKFEINDDVEILKSIGMLSGLDKGDCSPENLRKLKHLIPESLWPYLNRIANGRQDGLDFLVEGSRVGGSVTMPNLSAEEFVEATLEESSRQSSSGDAMSPGPADYSDDDVDSDMSSDME